MQVFSKPFRSVLVVVVIAATNCRHGAPRIPDQGPDSWSSACKTAHGAPAPPQRTRSSARSFEGSLGVGQGRLQPPVHGVAVPHANARTSNLGSRVDVAPAAAGCCAAPLRVPLGRPAASSRQATGHGTAEYRKRLPRAKPKTHKSSWESASVRSHSPDGRAQQLLSRPSCLCCDDLAPADWLKRKRKVV